MANTDKLPKDTIPDTNDDSIVIPSGGIKIGGITFASHGDLKTSYKEASRKTEVWTLSERINNIEKLVPIPKLTTNNWKFWHESVKRLIHLTKTSVVFFANSPFTDATIMWSAWWISKLREAAPHIKTSLSESPLSLLTAIVSESLIASHANLMFITQPHLIISC
ncbi:putative serine threonine protein kinase domain protein [Erysiphe necator]|uniref:Putative serine threonine protein kinase domain protein n=1 Tax=Uncinula necator TaxID=52586 RepID=A0A0B1PB51_UNCNE|nr:putative serine threonine protein kinase domain protein [Erysiphe necator]